MDGELAEDELEQLHEEFVSAIEDANCRLGRCDQLLRQGLRVEAIQEAELEPNLFDVVAELDIPHWDNFKQYALDAGFPSPPDL